MIMDTCSENDIPPTLNCNYELTNILNNAVQELIPKIFAKDNCPPQFLVSLFFDEYGDHHILLTINHNCCCYSKVIFPLKDNIYGYDPLPLAMDYLYDKTL